MGVSAAGHSGKVYLVGAGPGDPGLLTVKAHALLTQAQCVVYDYLVNPEILRLVPVTAEQLFVGKKGGQESIAQEAINELLIAKAAQYDVVIRLKGGDPFIFGRGGEEALALTNAGIPWEVVPGLSAGIAAPAYAGIPLTLRGLSSSVVFVTAHEDPAKEQTAVNWAQLAQSVDTLVVFMGLMRLPALVEILLTSGRPATTPIAVIRWGTYPTQEIHTSDLQNIVALVLEQQVKPPVLLVIGEVVRLREQLQWFLPPAEPTDPTVV